MASQNENRKSAPQYYMLEIHWSAHTQRSEDEMVMSAMVVEGKQDHPNGNRLPHTKLTDEESNIWI